MTDAALQQRIKYLVEHGGIWEDPMAEIRQIVRVNRLIMLAIGVLSVVDLVIALTR